MLFNQAPADDQIIDPASNEMVIVFNSIFFLILTTVWIEFNHFKTIEEAEIPWK